MTKYDPLKEFLSKGSEQTMALSFEQIEQVIGEPLPASAGDHRAWWANEVDGLHVQARAWMDAGWAVESVSLERRSVVFAAQGEVGPRP